MTLLEWINNIWIKLGVLIFFLKLINFLVSQQIEKAYDKQINQETNSMKFKDKQAETFFSVDHHV